MELCAPELTQLSAKSRMEHKKRWEFYLGRTGPMVTNFMVLLICVCGCVCVCVCVCVKELIQKYRWRKLCVSDVRPGCIIISESREKVTDVYITIWLLLEELPNDLNSNEDGKIAGPQWFAAPTDTCREITSMVFSSDGLNLTPLCLKYFWKYWKTYGLRRRQFGG